jgi:hypothetical protein
VARSMLAALAKGLVVFGSLKSCIRARPFRANA